MDTTTDFYERSYGAHPESHRRYPNEEFCRFMGQRFFGIPRADRAAVRILEVGSGIGANLWLPAVEGFDTWGIDLSAEGNKRAEALLTERGGRATLKTGSALDTGYPDRHFDAVANVFSMNCMDTAGYETFLDELARILKPGGWYFSYYPSEKCTSFRHDFSRPKLDRWTLDGTPESDPYPNNPHPWRFASIEDHTDRLGRRGLVVETAELVSRTYRRGASYYEFSVIHARHGTPTAVM